MKRNKAQTTMWCAAYRSAAAVSPRASAAGRAAVAAALTSTWHQRTFLSNAAATEAAAADNSDHHGDVGLAPRSIPVNLRPAPEEGGPHKRDPLQKKIDELKSALLAGKNFTLPPLPPSSSFPRLLEKLLCRSK